MDRALTLPLALILAPAGYGKTTLLSHWLAISPIAPAHREKTSHQSDHVTAVWLTLDEDDGDPIRFLYYLSIAFTAVAPGHGQRALELLADPRPRHRAALSLLLQGVEAFGAPVLLTLDDAHALPAHAGSLDLLDQLLLHAPANLHLLMLGRREPDLAAISRLRAAGLVEEIDAEALRFTASEAAALFHFLNGRSLAPDAARRLVARTEGWVTALLLAFQTDAWREVGVAPEDASILAGATPALYDFLARVVMRELPDNDRLFLRRTSILESLEPGFCDTLLERTDAAAILSRMSRRGLFTFVVDAERQVYRYHSLFRAFLQRELLESEGREAFRRWHRRAAAQHLDQGEDESAVHHLLEAEDWPAAAALIRSLWRPLAAAGRFGRLERWLSRFPSTFKETQPWLLLIRGRLETMRGHRRRAEQFYRQAEPLLQEAQDREGLFVLYHNLATLTASRHGDFPAAEALMRRAFDYAASDEDRAQALGYIARYRYMSQGDADTAQSLLSEAIELAQKADRPLLLADLLQLQGVIHSGRGLLLESLSSFHQALRILEHEGVHYPQTFSLQNALYTHYLLGQFDEAWALLPRAQRIAEDFGRRDHQAYLLNLKGLLYQEKGAWEEARACHEQALALQQGLGETYETPVTLNFLGLLHRRQGRLQEALRYGEMGLEKREKIGNSYETGLSLIDVGATCFGMGDLSRAESLWLRAMTIFQDYGARYEITQLHFYLALINLRRGDKMEMAAHWQEAMSRAHEYEHDHPPRCLHFFVADSTYTAELMAAALALDLTPDCVDCLFPRLGKPGREALTRLLAAPQPRVRARAAALLGSLGDPAAIKPLAARRQDEDAAVRNAALAALNALLSLPPPPLHVQSLGGFSLRRADTPITRWERSAARTVFLLLLLHRGRPVAMDWLMETLWPEHTPRKARKNLHQAVASLRRTLEPELASGLPSRYVHVENETYRLLLPPGSSVDFERFESRLNVLLRERQPSTAALEEVLALYRGEFLPEYPYQDWAAIKRESLKHLFMQGLSRLAKIHLEENHFQAAIQTAQRLLSIDPWNEQAVLLQMKAYVALGDPITARRVYETLAQRLREDLAAQPSGSLDAFYRNC